MILGTSATPKKTKVTGEEGGIVIAAGQSLRIETSPGGAEILDVVVPPGKVWTVTSGVDIDEEDA